MSDKSFGDHTGRGVVKNPLLSTAVTGLSIEDLTHNAVLLPAKANSELITRREQCGSQTVTLANTGHRIQNIPSGDANATAVQTDFLTHVNQNTFDTQTNAHSKNDGFTNQSKAKQKTNDDFDVNEYFARLQGTRYVSAPLNSTLMEDQNANLPTAEENLEEINLNEPEKVDDVQHSLTSDIAQNFSQLPTVLPQVASAVFSSFSSMLNLKSREQTPDDQSYMFRNEPRAEQQREDIAVPLSVPEAPRHVAPPPPLKEPPMAGATSYRMASKKKVYAQIPGLSAPDTVPFFVNDPFPIHQTEYTTANYVTPDRPFNLTHNQIGSPEAYNVIKDSETAAEIKKAEDQFKLTHTPTHLKHNVQNPATLVETSVGNAQSNPIIPPPPMFSNMQRRDSQSAVERAILPPSVARRVTGNQSLVKTQIPPPIHDNIFVPTFPIHNTSSNIHTPPVGESQLLNPTISNINVPQNVLNPIGTTSQAYSEQDINVKYSNISPFETLTQNITTEHHYMPLNAYNFQDTNQQIANNDNIKPQNVQSNISLSIGATQTVSDINTEATIDLLSGASLESTQSRELPHSQSLQQNTGNVDQTSGFQQEHLFFNPSTISHPTMTPHASEIMPSHSIDYLSKSNPIPEPLKAVPQPPKLTGNQSYRMNKKRPQYYSGPIEGIGCISNNIKPTLNPVDVGAFTGALFSPSEDSRELNQDVAPTTNVSSGFNFNNSQTSYDPISTVPALNQPDYNTAFDLSRPTTERYNQAESETKSSGLFGSLKSKLSSIDINKIQNTVTTFFDPAYKETIQEQSKDIHTASTSNEYVKDATSFDLFLPDSQPPLNNNIYPAGYNQVSQNPGYEYPTHYFINQIPTQTEVLSYAQWAQNNETYPGQLDNQPLIDDQDNFETQIANSDINLCATGNNDNAESINQNEANILNTNSVLEDTAPVLDDHIPIANPPLNNPLSFFSSPPVSLTSIDNNKRSACLDVNTDSDDQGASWFFRTTVSQDDNDNTFKLFDSHPLLPLNDNVFSDNSQSYVQEIEAQNMFGSIEASRNVSVNINKDFYEPDIYYGAGAQLPQADCVDKNLLNFFEQIESRSAIDSFDTSDVPCVVLPENIQMTDEVSCIGDTLSHVDLNSISKSNADFSEEQTIATTVEDNDLNICETCREVNKEPEESEAEDLTTQLIENIIAPIQLLNPVAANAQHLPLTSKSDSLPDIAQITEEIMDCIPIPLGSEILGTGSINNALPPYEWNTGVTNLLKSNILGDQNYNIEQNPNAIEFLPGKSLFFDDIPTNASDEIKAEFKISQDEPVILPRQMSVPTAPPDEDNKSDEGVLDVQSIEQDAKKDFPILYDEFVIEPSGTDDDKIESMEREKSSDEPSPEEDSFTNRVARFKQMEGVSGPDIAFEIQRDSTSIVTSPPLTMASYFDTGNYAVETHYRNSLTSPNTITLSDPTANAQIPVPPGFEKEYQRRYSGVASNATFDHFNQHITHIPDTQTQTHTSPTITLAQSSITEIKPTASITQPLEINAVLPVVPDTGRLSAFSSLTEQIKETSDRNEEMVPLKDALKEEDKAKSKHLPNPADFFSPDSGTSNQETEATSVYNDFSRLSSYFTSPPKTDNAKSFFELSQSQNHYRHDQSNSVLISKNVKDFFSTDTHKYNTNANMNLIRDLANLRDVTPNDGIVKTLNYFTVEYDHRNHNVINKPSASIKLTDKDVDRLETINTDKFEKRRNDKFEDTIITCKDCCNFRVGYVRKFDNNKIQKSMDRCDDKTERVGNMSLKNEGARQHVTVNFMEQTLREDGEEGVAVLPENRTTADYAPIKHHWFYGMDCEEKSVWKGFSMTDSKAIESAYHSPELNEGTLVQTDGGRYDVNIVNRTRTAVYWNEEPSCVRRCSWFYKGNTDARYIPYTEHIAEKLEEEYHHGMTTGEWHRRLILPNDEMVVMHGPSVMVHFLQSTVDTFSSSPLFNYGKKVYRNPVKIIMATDQPHKIDHLVFLVHGVGEFRQQKAKIQTATRPRVVRRGVVDSELDEPEPGNVDHLLLLCHGVGSTCDMRFRPVEAVVEDFRTISFQLVKSHYKSSYDSGLVGRIEVLPISWHFSLHSQETGIDRRLSNVTLDSIPKMRNFFNDTIIDVLFYTSPVFFQNIIETVCGELNRIYSLFKARNPNFKGGVSVGGHSLGSVILYDLLSHQIPDSLSNPYSTQKTHVQGSTAIEPCIVYPKLNFHPDACYALGSPLAIFECIRGVDMLGEEFCLPTCKNFFNIFHPYDPIAYRMEPMINIALKDVKPFLIPHHKGRKRMHLELKDTMARVGADIKQKVVESIKSTWYSMWKTQAPTSDQLEKVVEEEMEKEALKEESKHDMEKEEKEITPEMLGRLNDGRRVDFVLQEAPYEMINEYLSAMTCHVCYWESEDTMLLILREVYDALHVPPDSSVPQHTMTVQRTRHAEEVKLENAGATPSTSRGGL